MKHCAKFLFAAIIIITSCADDEEPATSIDFSILTHKKWLHLIPFALDNGQIIGLEPDVCFDQFHYFLETGESNYMLKCKTGNREGVSYPLTCISTCKDTTIYEVWSIDHATTSIKFNLGDGTKGNPFWELRTLNDTILIATKFEEGLLTGSTDLYLRALE